MRNLRISTRKQPPLTTTRESPPTSTKTQHNQREKNKLFSYLQTSILLYFYSPSKQLTLIIPNPACLRLSQELPFPKDSCAEQVKLFNQTTPFTLCSGRLDFLGNVSDITGLKHFSIYNSTNKCLGLPSLNNLIQC